MLSFAFDDEDEDEEDVASMPLEKKVGVPMLRKVCLRYSLDTMLFLFSEWVWIQRWRQHSYQIVIEKRSWLGEFMFPSSVFFIIDFQISIY